MSLSMEQPSFDNAQMSNPATVDALSTIRGHTIRVRNSGIDHRNRNQVEQKWVYCVSCGFSFIGCCQPLEATSHAGSIDNFRLTLSEIEDIFDEDCETMQNYANNCTVRSRSSRRMQGNIPGQTLFVSAYTGRAGLELKVLRQGLKRRVANGRNPRNAILSASFWVVKKQPRRRPRRLSMSNTNRQVKRYANINGFARNLNSPSNESVSSHDSRSTIELSNFGSPRSDSMSSYDSRSTIESFDNLSIRTVNQSPLNFPEEVVVDGNEIHLNSQNMPLPHGHIPRSSNLQRLIAQTDDDALVEDEHVSKCFKNDHLAVNQEDVDTDSFTWPLDLGGDDDSWFFDLRDDDLSECFPPCGALSTAHISVDSGTRPTYGEMVF